MICSQTYTLPIKHSSLKSLLHKGLSEPEFCSDLVKKFKKIMGRTDFSDQFRNKIIIHKRIGYDLNAMRQFPYSLVNPIMVVNFAALFNCTPVDLDSLLVKRQTVTDNPSPGAVAGGN